MTLSRLGSALALALPLALAAGCDRSAAGGAAGAESRVGADSSARARIAGFWVEYRAATEQRIAGQVQAAAEGYARALALQPDHGDALYYLGAMRLALGDYAGAERAWERLARVDSSSAKAHSQLGRLHLCLDQGAPFDVARAEAHLLRAHAINQEETGPLLRLGQAALFRGDTAAAGRRFREVSATDRGSVAARFYAGYLAWKRGDLARARALYREAAQVQGSKPAPAAGVPGEGDTRKGGPMGAQAERCRELDRLTERLGEGEPMEARYGRLDSLLQREGRDPGT